MTPEQVLRGLLAWALAHPDLAFSVLAVLAGVGHTARVYRRTGRIPLADLPWRSIRRLYLGFRRTYFTYPKPDRADLWPVNADIETFRESIGKQGYEPWLLFSQHYRDETVNCRDYYLDPEREYPKRQIHIRAWQEGDRVLINAHEEPSAIARGHIRAHLRSEDMTDCSRWVALNWQNGNGLDPRSFKNRRQREARRSDPKTIIEP